MTVAAVQWGDVATWVGSITTGLAFLLAAAIFGIAIRDRQRGEASKVGFWDSAPPNPSGAAPPMGRRQGFKVQNGSAGPIYDVHVESQKVGESGFTRGLFTAPGTVPPGETLHSAVSVPFGLVPRLRLEFTDREGRRWRRDWTGELRRVGRRRVGRIPVTIHEGALPAIDPRAVDEPPSA